MIKSAAISTTPAAGRPAIVTTHTSDINRKSVSPARSPVTRANPSSKHNDVNCLKNTATITSDDAPTAPSVSRSWRVMTAACP